MGSNCGTMGMKQAVSSVQPGGPIQFCIRRIAPGALLDPRTPAMSRWWRAQKHAPGQRQGDELLDCRGKRPPVVQHFPDVIQPVADLDGAEQGASLLYAHFPKAQAPQQGAASAFSAWPGKWPCQAASFSNA